MSIYWLLLLLLLSGSGGVTIGGALASVFGWFLLIILLVLAWEYKVYIFLFITSVIVVFLIKTIVSDYIKYKDETPEKREERYKNNKMVKEWREKNKF